MRGSGRNEWVRCPKCRGEVGLPENLEGPLHCPKCKEVVCRVDPETGAKWKPQARAPEWMKPSGYVAAGIGILGFVASALGDLLRPEGGWESGDPADWLFALVSGALNPLFFVGLPLGLYWLSRCGELNCLFGPKGTVRPALRSASRIGVAVFAIWVLSTIAALALSLLLLE